MTSTEPTPVNPEPPSNRGARALSSDDLVILNDEIRAFVRAGVPLDIGLRGTAARTNGALQEVSERLSLQLQRGISIEDALAAEGNRLPTMYRAVLAVGLRTGRLDDVLEALSELGESTSNLKRHLRLALIYPAIVFVLAYALSGAFILFVVPRLERTYELFNMAESRWVKVLNWLHQTVAVWGILIPAVITAALALWWIVGRLVPRPPSDGGGMRQWIPGYRDMSYARFARVFSLLVQHGVPLPAACRLSGQASGHPGVQRASEQLATNVDRGESLQQAVQHARPLPAFLCWLMGVGDRQGSLASSLRQAAAVYEQRALMKLEWFRRVVPPIIVVLCCGSITLLYGLTLFVPFTEMLKQLGAG